MRVAIIGAGPAGAMAAVRLARAGASVLLFDPSHPREKPCGGGLTGRALALVGDVLDVGAMGAVVARSALIEPPSPTHQHDVQVSLLDRGATPQSTPLIVSRTVFDRALTHAAEVAGARLITEKVVDIRRCDARMTVCTNRREHVVDQVLGADGATSIVRKKLGAPFTRRQLSVAAGFFVRGATAEAIVIKSTSGYPGYLWSFPRLDHLAVGICAPATHHITAPELRAAARAWITLHGLHRGTTLEPYSWPIPSAGFADARRLAVSGPGWMLLGDAAGLVDPLTREGIYYALLSGQWSADALVAQSGPDAAAAYAARIRSEIQPELARAARLSGLFFSPAFSSLFVDALRQSAAIRSTFVDLVAGNQPYRGLRRRLLGTREWRLAGRAIRLAATPAFTGTMKVAVSPRAT